VHQPYRTEFWGLVPHATKPRDHFRPVGVRTITVDHFNARVERDVVPENVKHRLPLDYSPTQRVLGLKTDDEYCISRIAGTLGKMVKNPAILHHP
jgi:hypothetical protein